MENANLFRKGGADFSTHIVCSAGRARARAPQKRLKVRGMRMDGLTSMSTLAAVWMKT